MIKLSLSQFLKGAIGCDKLQYPLIGSLSREDQFTVCQLLRAIVRTQGIQVCEGQDSIVFCPDHPYEGLEVTINTVTGELE